MAPTRVRAKDIAWQYLKRFAEKIPGHKVSESELFIEYPNGGRVTLYGADNDRSMGLYLDGIVFDECDEIPPTVWDVVSPALADRKGWAIWMGILRGRHNLFKRYEKYKDNPEWYSSMLRASQTKVIDDEELRRLQDDMSPAAYKMQMECDPFAAIAAAIYGEQMDKARLENRICRVPADPGIPLDIFFDVGHSDRGDDWAMWGVQFMARDIVCLDYHARTGQMPAYYVAKIREWEEFHRVRVRAVYLPHDAQNRNVVGKTHLDYLADAGLDRRLIRVVHRTPNTWDSINELRRLFPRIYINQARCSETWMLGDHEMPSGIDCLDYYHKKEEAVSGIIQDVPVHDGYSHGADALRTMAEAHRIKLLEGTSVTATETRRAERKTLMGMGADSYGRKRTTLR